MKAVPALFGAIILALALVVLVSGCVQQKGADELYQKLVEIDKGKGTENYPFELTALQTEALKDSSGQEVRAIAGLVNVRIEIKQMNESVKAASQELDKIIPAKMDCTSAGPILGAAKYYGSAIESGKSALVEWNNAAALNSGLAEKDRAIVEGLEDTISQLEFVKGELEKACSTVWLGSA